MSKAGEPSKRTATAMGEVPTKATLNVIVKSQNANDVFFRVKRDLELHKLLTTYCSRRNLEVKTVQFFYDGERIQTNDTPAKLNMEDGDEIDVMTLSLGGGRGVV